MANVYFAYSVKSDYRLLLLLPDAEPRRRIRACDVCLIRKTRCEETRPCRHCIRKGLACTDLRTYRKLGPKTLRKKTLQMISDALERRSLDGVAEKVHLFLRGRERRLVPLTVPLLLELQPFGDFSPQLASFEEASRTLALLTLAQLVLGLSGATEAALDEAVAETQLQLCGGDFSYGVHYHRLLLEYHLSNRARLAGRREQLLVHLRQAFAHFSMADTAANSAQQGLGELAQVLRTAERLNYLFDEHSRPFGVRFALRFAPLAHTSSFVLNSCLRLMALLEDTGVFAEPPSGQPGAAPRAGAADVRKLVLAPFPQTSAEPFEVATVQVVQQLVLFRVALAQQHSVAQDVRGVVAALSGLLSADMALAVVVFGMEQHFLDILRVALVVGADAVEYARRIAAFATDVTRELVHTDAVLAPWWVQWGPKV